ncbi:hypothetical protein GJ688_04715 [Heliobacillus mobilis]|uniref:Uncharacterized protein n=2 Tax=Heliobacterium TaxID=2697 RepID=A0A6I3SHK0_HELMO|nr:MULTISPECIES: hypothetical protein [Heliobacterium]MBC9784350.1 hypothetical protein [Heliobacterium chlorum]MTV48285.1 hypothetical protein [Heliobacterium mobile]
MSERMREIREAREAEQLSKLKDLQVQYERIAQDIQGFIDSVEVAGIRIPIEVTKLLEDEMATLRGLSTELKGDLRQKLN